MTDDHVQPELTDAMAGALRAELARQWGTEYDNYIRDVDWTLMARAAHNAHRGYYRPATGTGPVAEARAELAGLMATPLTPGTVDMEALSFILHLLDNGWHPKGRLLLSQRNQLFNALGYAVTLLEDAAGHVDGLAVQRVTATFNDVAEQASGPQ